MRRTTWWLAGMTMLATGASAQQVAVPSLGATNYAYDGTMTAPATRPSFGDEFNGKIDKTRWRRDTGQNKTGWPNHERQYYAGPDRTNARIEKGALVIEARAEALRNEPDWGGQRYSSAKLVTQKPLGYGFYEVRAELPCGRGMWPAIWLLPMGGSRWPDGGEIDDGRAYMRVKNDQPGGAAAWPFTRPYSLILNLAVGGDWGGQKGVDDAALPQAMKVDYVRYWKR